MLKAENISGIVGQRFGKWLVSGVSIQFYSGRKRLMCACVCDCGTQRYIMPNALWIGDTTQCRTCSNRQKASMGHRRTHGGSHSQLYAIWQNMKTRCSKEYSVDFHRYGARGIRVCDEWQDFATFRTWAEANGFQQGLTIDRRDNDRGYEPENCRWVDRTVQNRNRRNNQRFAFRGEYLMLSEIAERCGISHDLLRIRVKRDGFSIERAISQPKRGHPDHPTHRR
jgi:hypothetical protein